MHRFDQAAVDIQPEQSLRASVWAECREASVKHSARNLAAVCSCAAAVPYGTFAEHGRQLDGQLCRQSQDHGSWYSPQGPRLVSCRALAVDSSLKLLVTCGTMVGACQSISLQILIWSAYVLSLSVCQSVLPGCLSSSTSFCMSGTPPQTSRQAICPALAGRGGFVCLFWYMRSMARPNVKERVKQPCQRQSSAPRSLLEWFAFSLTYLQAQRPRHPWHQAMHGEYSSSATVYVRPVIK